MKNSIKLLLFNILLCAAPALQAMGSVRNASSIKNLLKSSTALSLPTCKPTFQQMPIPTPQQPKFSSSSGGNQNRYQKYQQKAEQFAKRNPHKLTFAKGFLGAAAGTAVLTTIIDEAKGIAETAHKKFDMDMFTETSETLRKKINNIFTEITGTARTRFNLYMFNENLISDEFSRAIVPIYSDYNRGSAFIVKSEHDPDLYFVLTAAHCVREYKQYIQLQHCEECFSIDVKPLIVNRNEDVAVFFIPLAEIKTFKNKTGTGLPSISAKQLSSFKPNKSEVFALQGYPAFMETPSGSLKDFHREKLIYEKMKKVRIAPDYRYLGAWFNRSKDNTSKNLSGASGGPILALRDKQPQVLGIFTSETAHDVYAVATGVGELPTYLHEAEKKAKEVESEAQRRTSTYAGQRR